MERRRQIDSPIGPLTLVSADGALRAILFGESGGDDEQCQVLDHAATELEQYFAGQLTEFTVAVQPVGTEFQNDVWRAVRKVPGGETSTYAEIARQVDRPKAVRAVGAANGANPIPIIIPCHRIIGSSGDLTGYAGGLDAKLVLLRLEGSLLL